ncbi:Uncharacterized conserved protein, DUF2141 family [Sphingomonas gellani]|uniref:Uncharacterized conserved protein, DUF2141 family n=1 Tax=Sphingomonas gellani TaxID=1166340 RepID=A0A1H8DT65_9SPHN|nr:DUF2141 domain-containing protein [Sphingomonas gellani]SEN10511.1 Uncharacterized conserved protein, DUF2141 family [Sphingomonas gellani]
MTRIFPSLAVLASLLAVPSVASAQTCTGDRVAGAVRLETVVTDVRNAHGEVAITIYANDPKKFLAKGGKLLRARVPSGAPTTRACFWLPAGQYEVAVYHDENGDQHFNRTLFMPKEGYAFSNDAPTTFGLPKLSDARFTLPAGGASVRMKMRYP